MQRSNPLCRITSRDIARKAGVSQPTVSRALRRDPSISPCTRDRILQIAHELNYVVDKSASDLRRGVTSTIALVVVCRADESRTAVNPFYFALLGGIATATAERGLNLLTSFQSAPNELFGSYQSGRQADGLIVIGTRRNAAAWNYFEQIASDTHAAVAAWGGLSGGVAGVWSDNFAGARLAVEHLLTQGRRRIAFIGAQHSAQHQFGERYAGYRAALENIGLAPCESVVAECGSRLEQGYAAAQLLIRRQVGFDGIFAACDSMALGAMQCLDDHGISVPHQVAVVGFDGIRDGAVARPGLSTIAPDLEFAGRALVENVLAQNDGRAVEHQDVPVSLIVRGSSKHS